MLAMHHCPERDALLYLQDYDVLNLIGQGGFASVYRARCITSGDMVAVKMIDKRRMKNSGMIQRVKKEVEIHSR